MRKPSFRCRLGSILAPLALAAATLAAPVRADLISPGELTKAHEKLEGLQNCTKCHPAAKKLTPEICLDCHKELRASISSGKGFHGRLSEKQCETDRKSVV